MPSAADAANRLHPRIPIPRDSTYRGITGPFTETVHATIQITTVEYTGNSWRRFRLKRYRPRDAPSFNLAVVSWMAQKKLSGFYHVVNAVEVLLLEGEQRGSESSRELGVFGHPQLNVKLF